MLVSSIELRVNCSATGAICVVGKMDMEISEQQVQEVFGLMQQVKQSFGELQHEMELIEVRGERSIVSLQVSAGTLSMENLWKF